MAKNNISEMSFLEHLEILRWHLVRAFVSVFIFAVIAFVFKDILFDQIIFGPADPNFFTNRWLCHFAEVLDMPVLCINQAKIHIQNITMAGQFTTHLSIAFLAGAIVAFPYIFFEFWQFIKPALYQKEINHSKGAIFFASILFSIGVVFAYYVIVPLSVHFLTTYKVSDQVENIVNLNSYISTVSSIVFAGGIVFELPMFIYFLSKVGLVSAAFLVKYRKHSIVASLLLAAIITPPDVVSQLLVCFPLIILYETGIIISRRVEKSREVES